MKEVIDLSYTLHEGMTTYHAPWHPITEITQMGRIQHEGRETRKISLGTHTGTHMDAPRHFISKGKTIDEISLTDLIGAVTILDFRNLKPNQEISIDLFLKELGDSPLNQRLLFIFGWTRYWGTRKFYYDYPYFSEDLARYLVSHDVKVVAMDSPSPDNSKIALNEETRGSELDSPIHKIFLSNEVILVEYINNTNQVSDLNGWNLCVLPLKIQGSDGAPSRALLFKE